MSANWEILESWKKRNPLLIARVGIGAVAGIYLSFRLFLPSRTDNRAAYWWSLAALLPLSGMAWWQPSSPEPHRQPACRSDHSALFGYSSGLFVAVSIALLYSGASRMLVPGQSSTTG